MKEDFDDAQSVSLVQSPADSSRRQGEPTLENMSSHGSTADGAQAHCQSDTAGLVDCDTCLKSSAAAFLETYDKELVTDTQQILSALQNVGSKGLTKEQLVRHEMPATSRSSSCSPGRFEHITPSASMGHR